MRIIFTIRLYDTGELIDLHTHTNESDGTLAPTALVDAALEAGLEALAITDHDTFAGYDAALPYARERGLRLVCGIELSCMNSARTTHLLGYFPVREPGAAFRGWLAELLASRNDRNRRLAEKLQAVGVDVTVEEARQYGRSLTGRPHFAKVLVEKGYAKSHDEAFRRYIGEQGSAFVERNGPSLETGIAKIREAGGVASVAHPIRVSNIESAAARLAETGLDAIEVWHTDHSATAAARFLALADKLRLAATGGSDFHGDAKPAARLGRTGTGEVPLSILDALCERASR